MVVVQQPRRVLTQDSSYNGLLDTWREQVEQARRGQSAGRNLAREGAANPYEDFLECLFFYYREDARAAEKGTGEG